MKKLITFNFALKASLLLYILLLVFHLAIIFGILFWPSFPVDFVWGGKGGDNKDILSLELVSFFLTFVFLFITMIRGELIKVAKLEKAAKYSMWFLFFFFLLNTLGNITSNAFVERTFTIVSLLLGLFSARLALDK